MPRQPRRRGCPPRRRGSPSRSGSKPRPTTHSPVAPPSRFLMSAPRRQRSPPTSRVGVWARTSSARAWAAPRSTPGASTIPRTAGPTATLADTSRPAKGRPTPSRACPPRAAARKPNFNEWSATHRPRVTRRAESRPSGRPNKPTLGRRSRRLAWYHDTSSSCPSGSRSRKPQTTRHSRRRRSQTKRRPSRRRRRPCPRLRGTTRKPARSAATRRKGKTTTRTAARSGTGCPASATTR